jgi:hypothetical protein
VGGEAGDLDQLVVVSGRIFLQLAGGDFEGFFGGGNCNCYENKEDAEKASAPCE